ncbi:MAG: nucleotidyltransferase family protein [Clostridiales bacterium]|nr:nucleotidyltransferase family protein [Clostridiales bacterium]
MKNCGIVCEYNPFHSGHKYQIDEVRRHGFDNVICVMSGSFVQSAEPAFCDKSLRAECAIMGGTNAVIELPVLYATASAQFFAEGAIKILSGIKSLTHIAMGAVAKEEEILRAADIKIKNCDKFNSLLKEYLAQGKSYNSASNAALIKVYQEHYPDKPSIENIFTDPNNILCIEYISAIEKYAPSIQPLIIERRGATYNDGEIHGEHISATAIRIAEMRGQLDSVKNYIPYNYDKIEKWRIEHSPDLSSYGKMLLFSIKSKTAKEISTLRNCSEGLEFLVKNSSVECNKDSFISAVIGKRYSKKRIMRLLLDSLLDINSKLLQNRFVTRLLACSKSFDFSLLPNCVKTTNNDIKLASSDIEVAEVLKIDENATALYNTLCGIKGGYYNYSLVKL